MTDCNLPISMRLQDTSFFWPLWSTVSMNICVLHRERVCVCWLPHIATPSPFPQNSWLVGWLGGWVGWLAGWPAGWLVFWAQSTTKDYIRAEHKLHSISKSFISVHKSSYHKSCFLSLFVFRGHSTREPASSRMIYFILRAYTGTGVSHSQHREKIGRGFGKNAGEWTGRVEN